mgnify:FL=1|tara:strand:- start:1403 stop:1870 length:468 start_codon:yes stop_codon:yes gene_type:complete
MALGTTFTDYQKVSDVRLNKITTRRTLANTIERASTIVISQTVTNTNAGDHFLGVAPYDMELVKASIAITGDEGTDGAMTIEKWDDYAGSAQATMTDAQTATGGASALYTFTPTTDDTQKMTAGEILNLKTVGIDGSEEGIVTLVFKLVDNVDNS